MTELERRRLDRDWSRKDLAERSGVSDETIRQIEEHGQMPRAGTAGKLAAVLDLSTSALIAALRGETRETSEAA